MFSGDSAIPASLRSAKRPFAGSLACIQYLFIVATFRYSQVYLFKYAPGASSWLQNVAPSELFKSLLLFLTGVLAFTLARKLKERFSGLNVLFLSGYAAEVTGAELSGDPVGELLQKPFSRVDLLRKLRQLIDG